MFKKGELVWAKSTIGRQIFWPAKVIDADNVLIQRKRKRVIGCVQFLVENSCEAITDSGRLFPFHIERKHRFLKKGRGLKDPHKRLQFDSAVKQAEQQIDQNSEEPSNTTYCKTAGTAINHSEANPVGKTSAFAAPKFLNKPKNTCRSAEWKSQKLCKSSRGENNRDPSLVGPVSKRSEMPLTRRAKRTRLFDYTKEGNDVEGICKQGKEKGKDSQKNASSPNRCKKRCADLKSSEKQIFYDCYEERPDVSPLQPNMKFDDNLDIKQDTENFTVAQTKYGANVSFDISTRSLNDISQSISNDNCNGNGNVDQDGDEELLLSNDLHLNGVDRGDDEADTTKNNPISEDEDELPEAFSPSPGSGCNDFHSEDVIWAKFKGLYWPAQIGRVTVMKSHRLYYVCFLPKQGKTKCMKINKKNIIPFTRDPDTYQHYKNQEIKNTEQGEFEEALKQAEDILVRKASKKDNVFFPDDKDLSDDGLSTLSEFKEPCEHNDTEGPVKRLKNETGESGTLTTPELRRSQRKGRSVSVYNEIILEFHRCKSRLVNIFHGKVPCDRHRTFHDGTVAEKDYLKNRSGFGPIQNDETCDKIIEILTTWYKEVQKPLIQLNYVFDVWLPEAIIFFIMNNECANHRVAEMIYLDDARHVSKKDAEGVSSWLKNHKMDENAMQESLERAKRAFQRY